MTYEPQKSAQELWVGRLTSGTWTAEYLVPEMKAAAASAAAMVTANKALIEARSRSGA